MNRLGFFSTRRRDETMPLIYSSTTTRTATSATGNIYIVNGSPSQSITLNYILTATGGNLTASATITSSFFTNTQFSNGPTLSKTASNVVTLSATGTHTLTWEIANDGTTSGAQIELTSAQASGGAFISNPT